MIIKYDIVLHANTTASSAMLEQARCSTLGTSCHVRSWLARHVVLVVSWCNMEFGLYFVNLTKF